MWIKVSLFRGLSSSEFFTLSLSRFPYSISFLFTLPLSPAYILAFSTIMLNTDAHNKNIAEDKKMTVAGFKENVSQARTDFFPRDGRFFILYFDH